MTRRVVPASTRFGWLARETARGLTIARLLRGGTIVTPDGDACAFAAEPRGYHVVVGFTRRHLDTASEVAALFLGEAEP